MSKDRRNLDPLGTCNIGDMQFRSGEI